MPPLSAVGPTQPPPSGGGESACWRCRRGVDRGATFCRYCGARYSDAGARVSMEDGAPRSGPPTQLDSTPGPAKGTSRARIVAILKDGSDGDGFNLSDEQTDIGRSEGQIVLGDDPYLSPRHARLHRRGEQVVLRDMESLNGVYVRIRDAADLKNADMILLGQQVLRFETIEDAELPLGPAAVHGVLAFGTPQTMRFARLVQYTTEGIGRDTHYLYRDETVLGRETGDIVFTDDPFLSRRHASIVADRAASKFTLRDLGSSNGTAIRCRGEHVLRDADLFRVGRHLFRFDANGRATGGSAER